MWLWTIGSILVYLFVGWWITVFYLDFSTSKFARWINESNGGEFIALWLMWPVLVLRWLTLALFSFRHALGLVPSMGMVLVNVVRMK